MHRYATCMVKIAWSEFVRRKARLLLLFRHHAAPFATLSVLVQCSKFGFNLKFCFIILQFTALLNAEFGLAMIISLILHPISNVPRLQLCHQLILPGMASSLFNVGQPSAGRSLHPHFWGNPPECNPLYLCSSRSIVGGPLRSDSASHNSHSLEN